MDPEVVPYCTFVLHSVSNSRRWGKTAWYSIRRVWDSIDSISEVSHAGAVMYNYVVISVVWGRDDAVSEMCQTPLMQIGTRLIQTAKFVSFLCTFKGTLFHDTNTSTPGVKYLNQNNNFNLTELKIESAVSLVHNVDHLLSGMKHSALVFMCPWFRSVPKLKDLFTLKVSSDPGYALFYFSWCSEEHFLFY